MVFIEIPTEGIVEQTRKIREMTLVVEMEVEKLRKMCDTRIKIKKTDTTVPEDSGA